MQTTSDHERRYAPLTFESIANRMSVNRAARLIHKKPNVLKAAIECGDLRCIRFADDEEKVYLTEELIEEWVNERCVRRKARIP